MQNLDSTLEIKDAAAYSNLLEYLPSGLENKLPKLDLSGSTLKLILGVSTVGKDTLLNAALKITDKISRIPRATSRARREEEVDGVDYFFNVDKPLLWSEYGGNYYAITEQVLERLKDMKRAVMVQGIVYFNPLKKIMESCGGKLEAAYILPVDHRAGYQAAMDIVQARLKKLGRDLDSLRLKSIQTELEVVFTNYNVLQAAGIKFISNSEDDTGVSQIAVKQLVEFLEN